MLDSYDVYWFAGLWAADRGTLAKGVVSIRSKDKEIIEKVKHVFCHDFGVSVDKIRMRTTMGYGRSTEVYFVSS
ncbi:MAG: hypothetical protein NZ918_04705, partial [Aigarchaeota archaeon]|nr:hypothetical protein [Aigarchaeota archaeon]